MFKISIVGLPWHVGIFCVLYQLWKPLDQNIFSQFITGDIETPVCKGFANRFSLIATKIYSLSITTSHTRCAWVKSAKLFRVCAEKINLCKWQMISYTIFEVTIRRDVHLRSLISRIWITISRLLLMFWLLSTGLFNTIYNLKKKLFLQKYRLAICTSTWTQ